MRVVVICILCPPVFSRLLPRFQISDALYYYFARYLSDVYPLGKVKTCSETENVTTGSTMTNLSSFLSPEDFNKLRQACADVSWLRGGNRLSAQLPVNWTGICALTQLVMPFTLIKQQLLQVSKTSGGAGGACPRGHLMVGYIKMT